ncbi:MAG: hypothetical protein R2911_25430 [Caldilineaceae bacterium]
MAISRRHPPDAQSWPSADNLYGGISFTPDFSHAALTYADQCCTEVMVIELDGATSDQPVSQPATRHSPPATYITNFDAQTADWPLAKHEVIQWASSDGTTIEGVLTKPLTLTRRAEYPLLVVIHGGPTGTSIPSKLSLL